MGAKLVQGRLQPPPKSHCTAWVGLPSQSHHKKGSGFTGTPASRPSPAPDSEPRALSCLSNNILRIDCQWSPELGEDTWLLFTSLQAPGSRHRCVFHSGSCSVHLPPEEVLVPSDCFSITLHRVAAGKERVSLVDPQYLPRKHVKLDPPTNLQSNVSADHCVLTWEVSPVLEPLGMFLSYELAFKRQEEAWERARRRGHILGATWILLEAVELEPGATYEARLRMQMAEAGEDVLEEERYEGQWSEWSRPAVFPLPRTGPPRPPRRQSDGTLVTVALFLLLTSLAYVLCKLSPRVKSSNQKVPSPAAFFQPLYSVYHGNFQTWTGAHGVDPQLYWCVRAPEPSTREAIAPLTCDPVDIWTPAGLPEDESTPSGSLTEAPPTAYLPQEDWALASPEPEGDSSYCTLRCLGEGQAAVPPRSALLPPPPHATHSFRVCAQGLLTAWGQAPHGPPEDHQVDSLQESSEAPPVPRWGERTEGSGAED